MARFLFLFGYYSANYPLNSPQHVATYLIDIAVPAENAGANVALLLLLPMHYTSAGELTG